MTLYGFRGAMARLPKGCDAVFSELQDLRRWRHSRVPSKAHLSYRAAAPRRGQGFPGFSRGLHQQGTWVAGGGRISSGGWTKSQELGFSAGKPRARFAGVFRTGIVDHLRTLRSIGVEDTLNSYSNSPVRSLGDLSFLPVEHTRFIETLRPYFRLDGYLFIHAGTIPGEDLDSCPLDRLLTVRERFLQDEGASNEITVFGHTPFETPFVTSNKIGIDTGAVYGKLLTAVELPRMHFYHA